MNPKAGRIYQPQSLFLTYITVAIIMILVFTLSACGGAATLALPGTETPSPTATIEATTTPAVEGMSTEADSYLKIALDYIEENSVMRSELNWQSLRQEALSLVKNAQATQDTYPAIRYVIKQLGDHHSSFLDPEEAEKYQQGVVKSLGLVALYPSGEVIFVAAGSPAEKGGLRVGDLIEQVNGQPLKQSDQIPTWAAFDETVKAQITFKHSGQAQLTQVTLDPAEYLVEDMPQGMLVSEDIGYIKLPQFMAFTPVTENYSTVAHDLIKSLDEQGACGWIVDLRQNRGGNMWPMLAGIGPVLGEGELGSFIDVRGSKFIWIYRAGQALIDNEEIARADPVYALKKPMPAVAVLTGPATVSSGEAVTIAFRGRPNTRSFGEPTSGLSSANDALPMSDGAVIVLTSAWELDRTGHTYRGSIDPDQPMEINWSAIGTENDPVMRAATDWLHTQTSCSP